MDTERFVGVLRQDGNALVAAAASAPDVGVPTCPDWDMAGLLRHVGGVHRWAAEIVRAGTQIRRRDMPRPDDEASTDELTDWYGEGLTSLCAVLADADPGAETWTFAGSGDRRASWWVRRMAAETAVHRWDAQHAAAPRSAEAVDPAVAAAGIDEYLVDMLPGALDRAGVDLRGTLHLHATDPATLPDDTTGEWLVDFGARPPAVSTGHVKADTAVRAPVSDLLLWLNNRLAGGGASIEVFGEPRPVTSWPRLTL